MAGRSLDFFDSFHKHLSLSVLIPAAFVDLDVRLQASAWPLPDACDGRVSESIDALVLDANTAAGAAADGGGGSCSGVGGQLVGRRVGRDSDGALGRVLMAVAESDVVVVEWDNGDEEDLCLDDLRFL